MIGDGDLDSIFENGDFDTEAVFTVAGPSTVTVRGWFTDATQQTNLLTQEIETVNPSLQCKAASIATVKRGNSVVIDTVTYTVERIERVGTGVALVHLKT